MNIEKLKGLSLFSLIFITVLGSSYIFMSTVYELQFTNSTYFKNEALSYRIKTEVLEASR